jgi:hypothetical protein
VPPGQVPPAPPARARGVVSSVSTDAVVPGESYTALTWMYAYSGVELTSACPPAGSCVLYKYQLGTGYPATVMEHRAALVLAAG